MSDTKPTYDELEQALIVEHRTTAALRARVEALTQERDAAKKEVERLRVFHEDDEPSWRHKAEALHATLARVEGDLVTVRMQRESAYAEVQSLRCRIRAVDAEHDDMERQKHASIRAFQDLEQRLAQAAQERDRLTACNAHQGQRIVNLEGALVRVNEERDRLRAALDRLLMESLAIHGDDLADERTIEQARQTLK